MTPPPQRAPALGAGLMTPPPQRTPALGAGLMTPPPQRTPALGAGLMTTAVKIFGRCNILEKPRFPPNYQVFSWPAQENVFLRN
jgi:hypothetical protein